MRLIKEIIFILIAQVFGYFMVVYCAGSFNVLEYSTITKVFHVIISVVLFGITVGIVGIVKQEKKDKEDKNMKITKDNYKAKIDRLNGLLDKDCNMSKSQAKEMVDLGKLIYEYEKNK